MATYKVPQDVEAEDKLLGPLTFKQFIFFLVAAGAGLVAWLMFQIHPLLVVVPVPVILIFGGLAVFRREDQPMERYLLSFFNFLLRPRERTWNTEGYYEHLLITKQKKPEPPKLKQDVEQVQGQLEKLAQTVDTRGWATKRPELTLPGNTTPMTSNSDDRLFMPEQPQEPAEVHEREDIMSEENPEGVQLDNLLHEQTRQRREELMQDVRQQAQTAQPSPNEQAPSEQPAAPSTPGSQQQPPGGLSPGQSTESPQAAPQPEPQPGTDQPPADSQHQADSSQSGILDMSNELSVSQIAAAAKRRSDKELEEGEEIQLR